MEGKKGSDWDSGDDLVILMSKFLDRSYRELKLTYLSY